MSAIVTEGDGNWKKAENETAPKRSSLVAPDPDVLQVLQGHSSQGQILTENDHEESDEENVIAHGVDW
jgi:hypothetical protein